AREEITAIEDLAKLNGGACAIFLVQIDQAADVRYGCGTGADAKLDATSRLEQAQGFIVFPGARGDQSEGDRLAHQVHGGVARILFGKTLDGWRSPRRLAAIG